MKKHIVKILSVVAILVICVSAFVIPSFAYNQTNITNEGFVGANITPITFSAWGDGFITTDTTPLNWYSNLNNFSSTVISLNGNTTIGDVTYIKYGFKNVNAENFYVTFPTIVTNYNDNGLVDAFYYDGFLLFGDISVTFSYRYFNNEGEHLIEDTIENVWFEYNWDSVLNSPSTGASADCFNLFYYLYSRFGDGNGNGYLNINPINVSSYTDVYVQVPYFHPGVTLSDIGVQVLGFNDIQVNTTVNMLPIGDFLWHSVMGFLDFELVPGVSLGIIFAVCVSIPLVIWFLKMFAGG